MKKILALCLAALLSVSLLAGCRSGMTHDTNAGTKPNASQSTAKDTQAPSESDAPGSSRGRHRALPRY